MVANRFAGGRAESDPTSSSPPTFVPSMNLGCQSYLACVQLGQRSPAKNRQICLRRVRIFALWPLEGRDGRQQHSGCCHGAPVTGGLEILCSLGLLITACEVICLKKGNWAQLTPFSHLFLRNWVSCQRCKVLWRVPGSNDPIK